MSPIKNLNIWLLCCFFAFKCFKTEEKLQQRFKKKENKNLQKGLDCALIDASKIKILFSGQTGLIPKCELCPPGGL